MTAGNDSKIRLLIVEDHQQLAENLSEYLGEDQYELDFAANGLTALHLLASNNYDVVILDVMLPGVDGFTICRRIRKDLQSFVPVIMLTARDSIDDKTQGFEAGADDYLVKPFHMRELELRVQALSRRRRMEGDYLVAGKVQFSPGTLTVKLNGGAQTRLSGHAATLFEGLIRRWPNFLSYAELSESLWGNSEGDHHTIRTHIYALRKQLADELGHPMIKTVHGRGYILDPVMA